MKMICEFCGNEFRPTEYHPYQKYCSRKCCWKRNNRRYYAAHRKEILARTQAYNESHQDQRRAYREATREQRKIAAKKRVSEGARYLNDILDLRGCERCGINDIRVLEFHHREPREKVFGIRRSKTRSKTTLDAEIAKCDILCANCHLIIHSEIGAGDA